MSERQWERDRERRRGKKGWGCERKNDRKYVREQKAVKKRGDVDRNREKVRAIKENRRGRGREEGRKWVRERKNGRKCREKREEEREGEKRSERHREREWERGSVRAGLKHPEVLLIMYIPSLTDSHLALEWEYLALV